jgi:uncharacterized protein YprB with RNaseH-like and TPR domain
MTELRGKLRRAFRVATPEAARAAEAEAEASDDAALTSILRRHHERVQRRLPRVALPVGEELINDRGVCYLRRLRYALDHRHGNRALGAVPARLGARVAELARRDDLELARGECLFLDTETTGLAGGAGTVVFLCGLGFFSGDELVIEQVLLRAFAEEAAALAHVAQRLAEHPALVTYVGKSFDRHRLAARMSIHRIAARVLTDRHLDLYHLARRAYRATLPDFRLRTVEESLLDVRREGDLPGAAAPWAFLSWLRDGTGRIDRVLEHNRLDVLSLVTLLGALSD